METMDPHVLEVLAITVAAAAIIVLGQAKGALESTRASPLRRVRSLQAGGKPLSPLRVALASGRRGR
jgi:hypothetical protein